MGNLFTAELKRVCELRGCPVCRIGDEAAERYLYSLLWEYVNDGAYRGRFLRNRGFCRGHSWQLFNMEQAELGDNMGTAILYEDLASSVGDAINRREKVRPRRRRWPWSLFGRGPDGHRAGTAPDGLQSQVRHGCAACETAEQTEAFFARELATEIAHSGSLHDAYLASDGLCLRHLEQALATGAPGVEVLGLDGTGRMLQVAQRLQDYLARCVYPRSLEPKGRAGQAPTEALFLLAGAPPGSFRRRGSSSEGDRPGASDRRSKVGSMTK